MIELTELEARYLEDTLSYLVECLDGDYDGALLYAEDQIRNSLEIVSSLTHHKEEGE